jgi:hypothetical protein
VSGCDAGREFVKNTDRVAALIGVGQQLITRQTELREMSPTTGVLIAQTLLQLNTLNTQLIDEGQRYVSVDGKRLEINGDGKTRLLSIANSAQTVVSSLLTNPEFGNLSPAQRQQWIETLRAISDTLQTTIRLIQTVEAK